MGWLLVSYRGYGASEGSPRRRRITADALRWYDHAVKEIRADAGLRFRPQPRQRRRGAARRRSGRSRGVVLVTPFDSLVGGGEAPLPVPAGEPDARHRFDSIAARAEDHAAAAVHRRAERDEVIPPEHARRLYEAWGGPKQWISLPGRPQ